MNLSDSIAFYRIFLCVSLTLGTQLPMDESLRIRCGVSLQGRAAKADKVSDSDGFTFLVFIINISLLRSSGVYSYLAPTLALLVRVVE